MDAEPGARPEAAAAGASGAAPGTSGGPTLRVARPTGDLSRLVRMYRDGLGLELLGEFADHDGFDGVMLGLSGLPWHLEFTSRRGHAAGSAPSPEHLLVLYLPDRAEWERRVGAVRAAGFTEVAPENPYWARRGRTFADADGSRVVLQNAAWPPVVTDA
jgi:catechol 2,3-dioxygenase-like lactoylglutathione lyase family enzyme